MLWSSVTQSTWLFAVRVKKWSKESLYCAVHWSKSTLWNEFLWKMFSTARNSYVALFFEYCQSHSALPFGMSWNESCNNVFSSIMPVDHLNFSFSLGIGTLIANNVYDAAYPLHDVRMSYQKSSSLLVSLRRHQFIDINICCLWQWKSFLSVILIWKLF